MRLDVALEFLNNKTESFYDKNYTEEDLKFFFEYVKCDNPEPRII